MHIYKCPYIKYTHEITQHMHMKKSVHLAFVFFAGNYTMKSFNKDFCFISLPTLYCKLTTSTLLLSQYFIKLMFGYGGNCNNLTVGMLLYVLSLYVHFTNIKQNQRTK